MKFNSFQSTETNTCIICNSNCNYYFSKTYTEKPYSDFMKEIGEVAYHKCSNCGFTFSHTHRVMEKNVWNELNKKVHHNFELPENLITTGQPPYEAQALMLKILEINGIISTKNMLDFAAGYGTLSKILFKYFNLELQLFDPFVQTTESTSYVTVDQLTKYSVVINSAMFEHVLERKDLNTVHNLVAQDGCLIIHTVICENIPQDPDWFYLRPPVHTAFHTNLSMTLLMNQWGYSSSLYCPQAKCWVLFKQKNKALENIVNRINTEFHSKYLIYKNGFVDYWKGF